ncbi:gamma-glutamylcyclotransferase [soil metagenome]
MFLNGTAMSGQKDHHAIAGARFIGPATTAPRYRFFAVRDEYPGLYPVDEGGVEVVGELYEMTEQVLFESLLPEEPPELEIGTIALSDGSIVNSMQLQPERLSDTDKVVDISVLGSWRSYQSFVADNTIPEATTWRDQLARGV